MALIFSINFLRQNGLISPNTELISSLFKTIFPILEKHIILLKAFNSYRAKPSRQEMI